MANELRHVDVGIAISKAEWEAVGTHIFNNQAAGDIPYASSTSQLSRLGIGAAKTILSVNSAGTAPEWVASPAIVTDLVPDAADGAGLGTAALEFSDLFLADGAVINLGNDQDVTLTHVADTGLLLNSTMAIQFNDASQYINAPTNAILDINATDEIELNATLADVNANLDVSGTYTGGGLMTTGGSIVIPDAGNIGSASDTDAIAISSGGVVTMNQIPVFSAGINVSGGTIAGTIATSTQNSITTMTGLVTTGTIGTGVWQGTAIASAYIAADAITGAKIADDAIDSEHYTDGSIDNAHLADDAVGADELAADAVVNASVASGAAIDISKTALVDGTGLTLSTNTLNVDASQTQVTAVGTIATGVWQGTAVASAYLDADTAHLSTTQTFTGAKTFSQNVTMNGNLDMEGYSVFGNGSGLDSSYTLTIDRAFSDTSQAVSLRVRGTITATDGTGTLAGLQVQPAGTVINSGNAHNVYSAWFIEPNITETSGSVTTAATVYIQNASTAATNNYALFVDSGETRLDGTVTTYGDVHFGKDGTGVDVTFYGDTSGRDLTWDQSDNRLEFKDQAYMSFGDGNDFQIFHNGSNTYLDEGGTGALIIRANIYSLRNAADDEQVMYMAEDGAVSLYYDNAVKLATHTSGVEITGSLEVATIDFTDGDLAMTIADGGGVAFAQAATFASSISVTGHAYIYRADTGYEGGQLNFGKATDNSIGWSLDSYGNDANDSLRFLHGNWSGGVAAQFASSVDTFYVYHNFQIAGTNPRMIIGDNGAEDTSIVFDGNTVDYHIGLEDAADVLTIGKGTTLGTTTAFTIGSTPSIGLFRDAGANNLISIRPGATLAAANAESSTLYFEQGTVNWTNASGGDVTVGTQSVMALRSQAWAGDSNTLTFTNGATLWIEDAPSDADGNVTITNKFALWVDNGATQLDGTLRVKDDITLDGDGKWIYLKGGGVGTDSTGLAWTFSTADTRYMEIQMDYDTRASVGLLIHGSYPITIDATTQINFDIAGATHMTISGTNPVVTIGDGGAEDTSIVFDGSAADYTIGIDDTDDTYGIHVGSTITGSARRILVNASTIYVGIDHSTSATPTMEVFNKGASGTRNLIRFADAAERGKITHDGSSTTYSTTSDYRLKENEAEITDAIDRIHQMKPYKYNFKNIPDREKFGFFAHELAEVLPEAVIGIKDAVAENGDVQPQSIDYGRLTPLLTQAIKEIDERLKKLGG